MYARNLSIICTACMERSFCSSTGWNGLCLREQISLKMKKRRSLNDDRWQSFLVFACSFRTLIDQFLRPFLLLIEIRVFLFDDVPHFLFLSRPHPNLMHQKALDPIFSSLYAIIETCNWLNSIQFSIFPLSNPFASYQVSTCHKSVSSWASSSSHYHSDREDREDPLTFANEVPWSPLSFEWPSPRKDLHRTEPCAWPYVFDCINTFIYNI